MTDFGIYQTNRGTHCRLTCQRLRIDALPRGRRDLVFDVPNYHGPDRRGRPGSDVCRYLGPDRRDRTPLAVTPTRATRAVLAGAATFLVVGVLAAPATYGGSGVQVATIALRDTSGGLLALGGALSVVLWALTGRAARAFDGAGLPLTGGGLLILGGPWSQVIDPGGAPTAAGAAGRLAVSLPGVILLARSTRVDAIDNSVRPLRCLLVGGWGVLALLLMEGLLRIDGPIERSSVLAIVMILLGASYYVAGVMRLTKPAVTTMEDDHLLGWALVLWAFGDLLISSGFRAPLWCDVIGGALQVGAAATIVWSAATCLTQVLRQEGRSQLRLAGELTEISDELADEHLSRRSMAHDARNAMTAIRAAMLTLERHGPRLDPSMQEQMRAGIGTELIRLEAMLDQPTTASRASAATTS